MSRFKSIFSPKRVVAAGKSLLSAVQKAAMASSRRREIANDDDPWKVSAFVLALMELLLSVLLLLGAAIASITSHLVKFFGLEPPCTYIGCSHTLLPNFTKERGLYHEKVVLFYELCPDCRASRGYTKRYTEKSSHTEDNTEISSLPGGDDTSANGSSTSTSDVDVPYFDEDTYLSSDYRSVKRSSPTSSFRKFKNSIKLKHVKQRASNVADIASQVVNEDCIPLVSPRSISACSSISNAKDHCELLPTSMDKCRMPKSCQERVLQIETLKDDDASSHVFEGVSNGKHHYMLLEDDDEEAYEEPFLDNFEPVLGSEDVHPYMVLDDHDEDTSADGESHSEFAQPLLPRVAEAISEGGKLLSTSLIAKQAGTINVVIGVHASRIIESAEASNSCEVIEDSKEPTCTDAREGEHPYMLLEDDDEDTSKASFFEELHAESAQPLLHGVSDDDLEVPNSCNRAPTMVALLNSNGSSGIEQSTADSLCHELFEVSIQTSAFVEQQQHQYVLLEDANEDSCETSYLSEPWLQRAHECGKPAANVGNSQDADTMLLAKEISHCEFLKMSKESTFVEAFANQMLATDALLQGFPADHVDTCTQGAGCSGPLRCDEAMAEYHVKYDDCVKLEELNVTLLGLEIVQSPTKSSNKNGQVSLLDMESKCTAFSDPFEINRLEEIKFSDSESRILITEEASLFCLNEATLVQDTQVLQIQGQLRELKFSPLFCATEGDGNKASVPAEVCSIQDANASNRECTPFVKATSKASFETIFEEAVGQPDVTFENYLMKDKSANAADIMCPQQVHAKKFERVLNLVSKIAEQDKEEIEVDQDREEGLDALREALLAERKTLAALETELENERNAAAIATSQAMAMISRLQEEKSAMQLEVAQLQRMAEEKAEYDEQAMALLKEILFKRETEKHALEKEVEMYRERFLADKGGLVKKADIEDTSMWSSASLLSLSKIDEDQVSFSPKGCNARLINLPSLDEFCKLENTFSPCLRKRQNMAHDEHTEQSSQLHKSPDPRSPKNVNGKDEVDPCIAEGKGGSASSLVGRLDELHNTHKELRGTSRSIFATNDEETQFILERLWVLEEELRELQGVDGLGAQRKSCEVQYSDCSKISVGKVNDLCTDREVGGHADEKWIGMSLPVHDVYEVHSASTQQGGDIEGSPLMEVLEVSGDLKSSSRDVIHENRASTMCCRSSPVITHTGRLFHPIETNFHSAMIANQDESYLAHNVHAQFLKTTEGGLDVIQQLAVRLQVLETDRELLREILESFRHRDAELKLLQEIAQQLRELRLVGFTSISRAGVLQDPALAAFGKSCTRAFKKRRYCSEPGQGEVNLLHQRSI